jgi:prevent-host-death family protein
MNRVNIREARRRLTAIVDAAQRGESTVITRRGRQVASVQPVAGGKGGRLPDLSEFRSSIKVTGRPLSRIVIQQRGRARY